MGQSVLDMANGFLDTIVNDPQRQPLEFQTATKFVQQSAGQIPLPYSPESGGTLVVQVSNSKRSGLRKIAGIVVASIVGNSWLAAPAQTAAQNSERLQKAWRTAIAQAPTPGKGCFTASYPLTSWRQISCVTPPQRAYGPVGGLGPANGTVGNGDDYSAVTATPTSAATGYFPVVAGLRWETGFGAKNLYSLQLNSNLISNDPACAQAANPQTCFAGQQFVYVTISPMAFMQYWLVNYGGNPCPRGWQSYPNACFKNSAAVPVPKERITELPNMTLSGSAVVNGFDTLTMTTKTKAYRTTGRDKVIDLAKGWYASEFNVFGVGGGSEADFNPGTSLTVRIDLTDGTTDAPVCKPHDGGTGETNNLNLKKCTVSGGTVPNVQFKEGLKKT